MNGQAHQFSFCYAPAAMRTTSRVGVMAALALHAGAGAALLLYQPAHQMLPEMTPIMVSLIVPQPEIKPEPAKPKPRPRPKVAQPRPIEPPPLPETPPPEPLPVATLTAASNAPSPIVAPPPPAPPVPPAPIVAAAQPAPIPVIPPDFNAAYLANPAPVYPVMSRRMGEQGRVVLRVLVSAAGRAAEVQLRTSSGHDRLDRSALNAVKAWKFVPAKRGEDALAAWVLIPIPFTLN